MSTVTPATVFSTSNSSTFPNADFTTSPTYSGTFIPTLWSSKLNYKFYTASVFGDITNTNWEGEISGQGDKIIINNIPSLTINDYVAGTALTYEVPVPETLELIIDRGKYFAFQVNDVLAYQAQPKLMDVFSDDASQQMKIVCDSTIIYNTFSDAAAANVGTTAGAKSASYNLGDDENPIALTGSNVLATLTSLGGVLDEQNVPESERWLVIDPATRQLLMQSDLAQAQFMGDSSSMIRNGRIGTIDRFTVYVSNHLPKAIAGTNTPWLSGDGSENSVTSLGDAKRRVIMAGHKSAITFASQMTNMETVRNPNDFGDFVRGLNVFGYKTNKPEALTYAVVS